MSSIPGLTGELLALAITIASVAYVAVSVRFTEPWQQALIYRRGMLHRSRGPGPFVIIPIIDQFRLIDIRIRIDCENE